MQATQMRNGLRGVGLRTGVVSCLNATVKLTTVRQLLKFSILETGWQVVGQLFSTTCST